MRSRRGAANFSVFSEPGSVSPVEMRRRCGIGRKLYAYIHRPGTGRLAQATRPGSLGRRNDRRQVAEVGHS